MGLRAHSITFSDEMRSAMARAAWWRGGAPKRAPGPFCNHTKRDARGRREEGATDEGAMAEALREAEAAEERGDVPVGAVVVERATGRVVARGRNGVVEKNDPTAHAEMEAIRGAARELGDWRHLERTTLVATVEPCAMCAGAVLQARVSRVVYGARSPRTGSDGSWLSLLRPTSLAERHPIHPGLQVEAGVLSQECSHLMKRFFQEQRRRRAEPP